MPMTEKADDFIREDDFAEPAFWSGGRVWVLGIFDRDYIPSGEVEGVGPQFLTDVASIDGVAQGDTLAISGTTYAVIEVQPDGTGFVTVRLRET